MKVFRQLVLATVVASLLSAGVLTLIAKADPYGRTWGYGYFGGVGRETGGFGNVFPNGLADRSGNKEAFISEIEGKLNGSNQYLKTGAAFIIQTMRGVQAGNPTPRPSAADVADWEQRVRDPNVALAVETNVPFDFNSGYMNTTNNGSLHVDDNAFYPDAGGSSPQSYVFRVNGAPVYILQTSCANPLGNLPGLPKSSQWTLSASSSVSQGTAKPGDTVVWTHHLNNNGPDATDKTVYSQLALGGFTNGWPGAVAGGNVGAGAGVGTIRNITSYATYTIGQNDVGNTLCERVDFSPANNDGGSGSGNTPCVSVPYSYNLTPAVDLSGQTTIEAGGTARVTNSATNTGPTKTKNTDWRLTRMVFGPGTTLSAADIAARTNSTDPCGSFTGSGRLSCDVVQEDGAKVFPVGTTTAPIYNYTAPSGLVVGSQVCFVVSVDPPTQNPSPTWRHSKLACMMVSKKPKLQVHGGDIRVGGSIDTGTSTVGGKTYGSWVEYGALSVGPNSNFASGSGFNNGASSSPASWSRLTFANIDDSGTASYGNYALSHAVMSPYFASLTSQFTQAAPQSNATSTLDGLASDTYKAGNLTIDTSKIGQDVSGRGKSIIIIASGTVTIAGNITYAGPGGGSDFTNPSQIPQVVIVASNINIKGSVTNVDAWLMTSGASGTINTCSDVAPTAPLDSTLCANLLTINGPVTTSHLYLRRTAGADDGNRSGDPAEVFNLRADTYLWQHSRSAEAGKAQTVYTSELPPRF